MGIMFIGCTSNPVYKNESEKNLAINLKVDERNGLFNSIDIAAGVNDIDSQCQPHYRGYQTLSPGRNEMGLAPGILTNLVIEVAKSKYRSGSSYSRGTLITPLPGKRYEIDASYLDNMFDFRLYEITGKKRKPLKLLSLTECKTKQGG